MKLVIKKSKLAIGVLIVPLILSACGTSSSGTSTQTPNGSKPSGYEFGLVMPMTGSSATFGNDQVKGALMGIEDLNKEGGIGGVPLKAITEDSQADPKRAITAYQKVVSLDKVSFLVTAWSSVVKAIAPMAEQDKVLTFSIGANDPKIKELGKFTRTAYPLADVDIKALAEYTHNTLGKKTAAIIYIANDTGKFAAEIYKKTFEAAGGKVVAYESHEPDKLEFAAQLSKIKQAHPDVVHIQSLVGETPEIILQAREMGINALLTSYSAAENSELLKKAGKAAEGLIYTSLAPEPETNPKIQQYLDRWQKEEGRAPNGAPYTEYLYDTPYLIKAIIEQLNKTGKEVNGVNALAALNELGSVDLPLTGKIIFNKDGSVSKPVYIKKIQDGQFKLVDTIKVK
ncbi:MAG: extracellular ligand-binding receptor [Bacilli bacterium]|nr:extracellular ligand-binding receptor [Bacilli bacterium]